MEVSIRQLHNVSGGAVQVLAAGAAAAAAPSATASLAAGPTCLQTMQVIELQMTYRIAVVSFDQQRHGSLQHQWQPPLRSPPPETRGGC